MKIDNSSPSERAKISFGNDDQLPIFLPQGGDMFGVELLRDRQIIERATIVEEDFTAALARARHQASTLAEKPDMIRVIDSNGTGLGYYAAQAPG